MRRKSIKAKFIGYLAVAIGITIVVAVVSFFFLYNMAKEVGPSADGTLNTYLIFLGVLCVAVIVASVLCLKNMVAMMKPIKMVSDQAFNISKGKSLVRSTHNENNELGDLTASINATLEYILGRVALLQKINEGDYSMDVVPLGETDKLTIAIGNVVDTNNEVLLEIKNAAHSIYEIGSEITMGAQTLASGATEQAATIEEFSAVMEEVQAMAEENADIAQKTLAIALESKQIMELSTGDIDRMAEAMDSITRSSRRIETVIKVIDEIAFQTNILALNAAVEAARAGIHGKGFAVVADEVRELASKSAAAARETSELIQMSIGSVSEGNDIMKQTSESISNFGMHAGNAAENMGRLADSSERQRQSISEINRGISQISNVIQTNAAMAQENSVSADKMTEQSGTLERLVARYKLRETMLP